MDLNLVFSVDLDAEHTGGKTQDRPYQEESERPWEKKMISKITSWEGLGWERIVTEHVKKGRYGNLKF